MKACLNLGASQATAEIRMTKCPNISHYVFFRFPNPYVMKVSLNLRVSHETAELWMTQNDKTCS